MHAGRRAVGGTGIGGRDISGLPAVDKPVIERRAVDVDQIGALDISTRECPNHLCRKQLAAGRVGDGEAFQINAGATVSAAHAGLTTVGPGDRPAQFQRRTQQVAHRFGHLGPGAGDEFGDEFRGQLVRVGHRQIPRVGDDGLTGGIDEVQGAALVGRLELLPVQEHPVGQPVDPPAVGCPDQLDGAGIG